MKCKMRFDDNRKIFNPIDDHTKARNNNFFQINFQ